MQGTTGLFDKCASIDGKYLLWVYIPIVVYLQFALYSKLLIYTDAVQFLGVF